MGLTIFTNVASLNAQRSLQKNNNALNTSFQRLSSGLRINTAGDDAAGLAIADRMQSQVRGLNQAVRNANDASSVLRTAEGGLVQTTSILQRLRELAVQAASDTNNTSDRNSIQAEADQLLVELDRIKDDTEFNDSSLLDGTYLDRVFQIGHEEGDTLTISVDEASGATLGAVAENTGTAVTAVAGSAGSLSINAVDVGATLATDDSLSPATDAAASAIAKATAINRVSGSTGVTAAVNAATVTGGAAVVADTAMDVVINGVTVSAAVLANDADGALQDAINAVENQTGVRASLSSGNALVLTADDGRNIVLAEVGGDTDFNTVATITAATHGGTITLTSDATITLAGGSEAAYGFAAGDTTVDSDSVSDVVLTTQTDSEDAITVLDHAIRQVGSMRSDLGAHMNRLDMSINVLSTTSENTEAAKSQIQDADFASETATFARNQIMQQAAAAMLAQANVSGQIALQLLGS